MCVCVCVCVRVCVGVCQCVCARRWGETILWRSPAWVSGVSSHTGSPLILRLAEVCVEVDRICEGQPPMLLNLGACMCTAYVQVSALQIPFLNITKADCTSY